VTSRSPTSRQRPSPPACAGILPPWQASGLLEDYAHYRRGEAAEVTTTVADITGRPPRDIGQFARDYAAA
jgi:hypothetical protein